MSMISPDQKSLEVLAARLGTALLAERLTLAAAESCTGGWVAQCVTAIAGSSDWFERGFVTYSNAAKQEMLGVPAATLAAHGAVSQPVAVAMAEGALRNSHADWALAITGVAGPSGGSAEKPVGTVCFAWACRGGVADRNPPFRRKPRGGEGAVGGACADRPARTGHAARGRSVCLKGVVAAVFLVFRQLRIAVYNHSIRRRICADGERRT